MLLGFNFDIYHRHYTCHVRCFIVIRLRFTPHDIGAIPVRSLYCQSSWDKHTIVALDVPAKRLNCTKGFLPYSNTNKNVSHSIM